MQPQHICCLYLAASAVFYFFARTFWRMTEPEVWDGYPLSLLYGDDGEDGERVEVHRDVV